MTLAHLIPHVSPRLLVMLAVFLLLRQGLNATMRPKCSRAEAVRNLLMTLASVVCLMVAAGVAQLIVHG